jgi:DNA-binding MarR family transcriptional regulator
MSSLPSLQDTLDGKATITVKQTTIAQNCGIKAVQTVSKVLTALTAKGLVEPIKRNTKRNGHKGTYIYTVKKLPTNDSFFFAERRVFRKLIPRQMMIYLFICKAYSTEIHDSWNSYNDIAAQTGMKRETVIDTIAELEELKLIRKGKRKAKVNRRIYVDNHYILILYIKREKGQCRKKGIKIERLLWSVNRSIKYVHINELKLHKYNTTKSEICQDIDQKRSEINSLRGSPQIYSQYFRPKDLLN